MVWIARWVECEVGGAGVEVRGSEVRCGGVRGGGCEGVRGWWCEGVGGVEM